MICLGFRLSLPRTRFWPPFGLPRVRELLHLMDTSAFLGTHPLEPGAERIHQHPERGHWDATTCEDKSRTAPRSHSEWSVVIGSRRMARSAGIQLAASATVVSIKVTPAKVGRSVGGTPKSSPAIR